jgi:hypothetical protein
LALARIFAIAHILASRLQPKTTSTKTAGSKPVHKFYVDYSVPASDNVFDPAAFEKFLHDRIKVEGKAGQLGDKIEIKREGECRVSRRARP